MKLCQRWHLRPAYILGVVVILAAVALGALAFERNLTPYVSYDEARRSERHVQVHGYLQKSLGYDQDNHFRFVMVDGRGDTLTVVCEKALPTNFEQAKGFVAIGRYDRSAGLFRAEQLLVQCPSKYQELGPPTEAVP